MSAARTSCAFFRTVKYDDPDAGPVEPYLHPEVTPDSDHFIAHLIEDKLPLGVALSGGGFRAATCAAGFMRGLHLSKLADGSSVLSKVQYLSSTSGGSWFNAAFSYKSPIDKHQLQLDDFFERYIEPEDLSLAELSQKYPKGSRSFEAAIAAHNALDTLLSRQKDYWLGLPSTVNDSIDGIRDWFRRTLGNISDIVTDQDRDMFKVPDWVQPWTAAVTKSFLEPYKLSIFKDSTVSADNTRGRVAEKRAAAAAKHVLLACTDKDRPYPILTGTAFNPPGEDGYSVYPLEFSPLYFGTPSPFPYSQPAFGGGYVEPFGLHAKPGTLRLNANGTGTVDVSRVNDDPDVPLHTVPLAQAVSISSSFLAVAAHNRSELAKDLASTERLVNWGVLPSQTGKVPPSGVMGFADGGSIDNLAVMPLLRRRVRCMIVLMASSTPPDDTWERFASEKSDIAALFGAAKTCDTPGVAVGEMNDMCHVFGKNNIEGELLFRELFDSLHSKLRAGKPGYHRASYMVKENSFFHIPASKEPVEVLWIHNQQWKGWERRLPDETHTKMQQDRKGKAGGGKGVHHKSVMERESFDGEIDQSLFGGFLTQDDLYRFPYFTTYALDYTTEAVKMLSQLQTAVVLQKDVQANIKDLLSIAQKAEGTATTQQTAT